VDPGPSRAGVLVAIEKGAQAGSSAAYAPQAAAPLPQQLCGDRPTSGVSALALVANRQKSGERRRVMGVKRQEFSESAETTGRAIVQFCRCQADRIITKMNSKRPNVIASSSHVATVIPYRRFAIIPSLAEALGLNPDEDGPDRTAARAMLVRFSRCTSNRKSSPILRARSTRGCPPRAST
jgi:hypothetical protein